MKRFIAILLFFIALLPAAKAQQYTEIYGRVVDEKENPLSGVLVIASIDNKFVNSAVTEDDGHYSIKPLLPNTYTFEFESSEKIYSKRVIECVGVKGGGSIRLNCKMQLGQVDLKIVTQYIQPVTQRYLMTVKDTAKKKVTLIDLHMYPPNRMDRNRGSLRIGGERPEVVIPAILVSEEKDSVIIDEYQYRFKAQNKTYTEKDYKYLPLPTFLQSLPEVNR